MRILAVAHNTFREAVRDKVLYVLLLLGAVAIFGSKALGWISIGQDIKIIKDISLASVSVFDVLIAIFVGTNLVYKEIDKRTIYTIICRPIHRFEFILGKYLGLAGLIAVVTAVTSSIAALYVILLGGSLDLSFFYAAVLIYGQLLMVIALAVLLSTLTSPILGALIVFTTYVIGHGTRILIDLPAHFDGTRIKSLLQAVYYVIPNFANLNIRAEAANSVPISFEYVAWAFLYATAYTVMLLVLAALAFQDRDV